MALIKTIEQLSKITRKNSHKKIGYVQGCFDIIHSGHIKYIKGAKKYVDILIAGVETDEYIKRHKGKNRPMFKLKDRLTVLKSIKYIDYIFVYKTENIVKKAEAKKYYRSVLKKIKFTHMFVNSKVESNLKDKKMGADEHKIKFIDLAHNKSSSSTKIYDKFCEWVKM